MPDVQLLAGIKVSECRNFEFHFKIVEWIRVKYVV